MKILAIGKNYVNEGEDKNAGKTGNQIIFSKPESSLATGNVDVEYPSFTQDLRYEAELVIKIGTKGKNISEADAAKHISEIGIGIDYTAKDIFDESRSGKGPWDLGKGFDGAAPMSTFKPVSAFPDLDNINFDLKINGEQKQVGNTSLMVYNFAEIIAFVSKFMTLEPGDLIFTGTPASGTGQIHKGDHLQASIEGELILDFKMV
ncbi:fumarylacetoacetate hydrolase family protein [Arcticibacterium luteifluviistationis]|uniref:FAA hydrolase family protein n=1 Tax=Arcticibacterium luteifluviistationis TaxID=1784714 RepID=A0A2Z4G9U3_9BACT|nr:fumarylacetoacetate hydrolase family protein [Arcticibacterium luteifluviistationis]AWV97981.1 FAA hydrolase family protein [Arcticibacterium luteifluviistationis]